MAAEKAVTRLRRAEENVGGGAWDQEGAGSPTGRRSTVGDPTARGRVPGAKRPSEQLVARGRGTTREPWRHEANGAGGPGRRPKD